MLDPIVLLGGDEADAVSVGGATVRPKTPAELLKIRGAMWSVRWSGRFGPRPGSPDNILAMDYYEEYEPAERAQMLAIYLSRGYTHAVTGPVVDPGGYHGQFPVQPDVPTQERWDHYLDCMQEWHDAGLEPIHNVHPDGWTLEQMDALATLYQQPRAQALLRIIVATGWEPTKYGWQAIYWDAIMAKVRGWMPQAMNLLHTVTETDAPTGNGDNFPNGNAGAWAIVAGNLHGWLIQNGEYTTAPADDPTTAAAFSAQFSRTANGSDAERFDDGYAGWPTFSAFGPGVPMKIYAGEQTAYSSYWSNLPESASRAWGDVALAAGADGALDGCTMPGATA